MGQTTDDLQPDTPAAEAAWTIDDATELYRLDDWGMGYFEIGPSGNLLVRVSDDPEHRIDLHDVVRGLEERGIRTPVTIGFPGLLRQRIMEMVNAFTEAIRANDYKGSYTGVYPIKVNQQRFLVEQVAAIGREVGFGLEVGSKPELLAVLGLTADSPDCLIVCNGFKEERYLRHVMLATKLGRRIVAVIENMHELETLLHVFEGSGVRPLIGVRLKLESHSSGRWRHSTGEKAKFGLSVAGVLEVVRRLDRAGMLDCLAMLHCHMGSQISDIQVVNAGLTELTRIYVELSRLGAGLRYLDVGGGLGVDYDGSQTNSDFSTNYTLEEYATTVVYRVGSGCDEADVPHPTIVTEAGRALVSHQSVLVCDVLGAHRLDQWAMTAVEARQRLSELPDPPRAIDEVVAALSSVREDRLLESYHDAVQAREEALTLFRVGLLDLEMRALVDRLFWSACLEINRLAQDLDPMPEELEELRHRLSDTYFCNLSVFQSLPDSWAIDQVFPIMPIHRLDEEPDRRATLVDITCDSDGKIDRFADLEDVAPTLPLHSLTDGEHYYLGFFLTGAYQETLGDLHNLFGDTNLVHIVADGSGGWAIQEVVEGDTVSEVLGYLQYEPRVLVQAIRRDCERSMRDGRLTVAEGRALLEAYDAGLTGYTYLE
ncbi:MAG TPA: biosynthetic arginine decarboxylase [Methylomirabilota bacterium]|nr:biosynthetic arginine decarboxylase [Methylomirabilota bacterium]